TGTRIPLVSAGKMVPRLSTWAAAAGNKKGPGGLPRPEACFDRVRLFSAAKVEQVVDAAGEHIDRTTCAVECGTRRNQRRSDRNGVASVAQPEIVELDLRGPIVGDGVFDAGAEQPAAVGVAVAESSGSAGAHIGDGEIVDADPATAGLAVDQPVVERD